MSNLITEDDFLAISGQRRYTLIDSWIEGRKIRIQNLSDAEQRELTAKELIQETDEETGKVKQRFESRYQFADRAIAQVVDDEGDEILGDIHREKLASIDFSITGPIHRQMIAWNRDDKPLSLDDAKKNSSTTQSDESTSDSPTG